MADVLVVAQVAGRSFGLKAAESDRLTHAGMIRTATGPAQLFTDNKTTAITIGGGTALSGPSAIIVDAGVGGLDLSAGAARDLSLTARGKTYPLNATGVNLTTSAQTIIEAINESASSGDTIHTASFTAAADQTVFTLSEAAVEILSMEVNTATYTSQHGYFAVSTTTLTNDTITWQNKLFTMIGGFEIIVRYKV